MRVPGFGSVTQQGPVAKAVRAESLEYQAAVGLEDRLPDCVRPGVPRAGVRGRLGIWGKMEGTANPEAPDKPYFP